MIEWTSTLFFSKISGWVCGIYTSGQIYLRWLCDQLLVSHDQYSTSLGSIKPVMRIMAIIHWKMLTWCTNKTLMSTEMKDSEGKLTIWTLKMMKDTMSLKIYLPFCKAKKTSDNQLSNFCLTWASFSLLIFLFSWRTTCLGPWPLGKWQWKVVYLVVKSTCSGQLDSKCFQSCCSH